MRVKARVRQLCVVALCFVLLFGLTGCKADISAYANQQILVTGLLEEDFYITPGELAELECVNEVTQGNTEKAGTVEAYGPTMETFLAQYGKSLDEFKSIRFTASDEYVVTIGKTSWDKYDVIMSIARGSDPLEEYQWPLRIVIPGGNSGNWIRSVITIEFTYLDNSED